MQNLPQLYDIRSDGALRAPFLRHERVPILDMEFGNCARRSVRHHFRHMRTLPEIHSRYPKYVFLDKTRHDKKERERSRSGRRPSDVILHRWERFAEEPEFATFRGRTPSTDLAFCGSRWFLLRVSFEVSPCHEAPRVHDDEETTLENEW